MPNSANTNANGQVLFLFIAILIVGLCSAAGTYLLPKQPSAPTTPTVDLKQQANTIASPLAKVVTQHGFDSAKQLVSALLTANQHLGAYLYINTGMGQPNLVLQQSLGEQIGALNREETYNKGQMHVYHMPLALDGQNVGELILTYTPPIESTATGSASLAYGLLAIALFSGIITLLLVQRKLSGASSNDTQALIDEINHVTTDKNYKSTLGTYYGGGLAEVAQAINALLQQVQSSIESDQATQNELKQLQESLETEVQARTLALEKAILNAERASDAKTTFLATMSHEIRTPMNGVIGTIDLLRQTELDGAQHRLTTIIRDSAFSLLGILDDILDFSKIEAGKLRIDNSPFSVAETTEEVARVLSSVAKKRKLDLQLFIAPDIPTNLVGDTVRVRQVLYNLCSNAIKFTTTDESTQGYVKISVEVSQNTSEHYTLRFTVTDNGKGMTKAQLREIFNPFIQAEGSITREFGGTGLGLSICKSLIELMLGSIHVNSDIGMGSEFVVELPFSVDGKVNHANKQQLHGRSVALITANKERQNILNRYLSFMGANVMVIDDAEITDHQHEDKLIWVLDGLDGMDKVNEELRTVVYSLEKNEQQVVVLSKMDEAALNHKHIFYLNASPLCKSSFMTSILVAAGLHKPREIKPARTINDFLSVDEARATNKLVLLVEDNVLNQQVLTDQLHLLGYGVEVAENGEEGFELWKKEHFPIVLTDLHMPKMSGYDMVKNIRDYVEAATDNITQPYIIAVTANALKGERERCETAGMNDYITKPVELNVLEATLIKCIEQLPNSEQPKISSGKPATQADTQQLEVTSPASVDVEPTAEETVTAEAPPNAEPSPAINMEMLNKYVNHDDAKRNRFFRMYLEQSSQLTRDVNGAVITMSQEEIIEACHQLKSISKTIGAEQVAATATEFETLCKEGSLTSDQLIHMRDKLEQDFLAATEFIQQYLSQEA
ncbi:hybrid sensor histidine kinase/response regulator [Pseudoalteromonas piscicida]|uniref:Sensory/regulatory protein RpfC n=1 Tax=Pseudoalteromonas piscicida TaxID=43662 RepID=A0A2A5JRL0_PSEO7|nr:hybrid sensor histidine kinase/response regulator [Pseudoalteromonas piscicida]PCK32104.1 hybrid sensor histidine kinase/response regulator [Pseudoalteromonas piscicida]